MVHRTQFSVHHFGCKDDTAAERLSDHLVPQANSKYWDGGGSLLDQIETDTGMIRRSRAGGYNDTLWACRQNLVHADLIVTMNPHVCAQFAQILNQVVSKAVVIIY